MHRKPDIIRAIVLIFVVGLAVTGFTSLQASEKTRDTGDIVITPPDVR